MFIFKVSNTNDPETKNGMSTLFNLKNELRKKIRFNEQQENEIVVSEEYELLVLNKK